MAIKDLITLGIGVAPGSIKYLLLVGLDISEMTGVVNLTLPDRATTLTLPPRTAALTLHDRSIDLTAEQR